MEGIREHQIVALKFHCRLAAETVQPRFTWRGVLHSIVLTVNSGYE